MTQSTYDAHVEDHQDPYETDPIESDVDLDETDLDEDEVEEVDDSTPSAAAKSTAPQRGLNRGAIRRIAAKAQEVSTTDPRTQTIAASLLGCGTGLADLTTAIMAAPRSVSAPINDLTAIAESDPMEAGVNAAAMGRDRIKAVWSLLASLDVAGCKSALPSANAKAAIGVAKAVFGLDDIAKSELNAVAALLKKN